MGTGSSISSIDHNIFQKPYEPISSLPVGQRANAYPPPTPVHPTNLNSHYVPPYPDASYPYGDSKSYYSAPTYTTSQPPSYTADLSSPNIFYTPPTNLRQNGSSSTFVKQEQSSARGWNSYDDVRDQSPYSDMGRKRKLSPCEMAYPDTSQSSHTSSCSVPNYGSGLPPIPYSSSAPYDYSNKPSEEETSSTSIYYGSQSSLPSFSLKEEKTETLTTTVSTDGDGYRWRKYGRKSVKGSPYPRSYYKCTFASCNVKKQVEMMLKDDKMVVKSCIYKGEHNHERPCITFAQASSQNAFKSAVIAGFMRHEKMLQGTGDVPRLSVETSRDVDFMDDGYRWRKYGQKYVKGSGYPRSYYKCTEKNCSVKKQVDQHGDRVTNTYEGVHTHPPCANHARKRRRVTADTERLHREVKEENETGSAPPGSSSEGQRHWPLAPLVGKRGRGEDEDCDSDEEIPDDEEEEEEELEHGQPIKIFGSAVTEEFDENFGDDFSVERFKAFDKEAFGGPSQPLQPQQQLQQMQQHQQQHQQQQQQQGGINQTSSNY